MTPSTEPDASSISVIVPTYNDVGRIGDALDSIVSQTVRPAEIVISDDGSDDGTERFVRDYGERHEGEIAISYVRLPSRSGAYAARNAGVAASRGRWIANCDSDDIWAPDKLQRQVEFIRGWSGSKPIVLLGTYGYNVNDAKRVLSAARMGPTSEQEYEAVWGNGGIFFVIHSSILFRRADFEAVGGYTRDYFPADEYDLWCRMAERGVVMNLPEPLIYYRKRAGSMQLDDFWAQRQGVWRLAENQRRRAAGQTPISSSEFAAKLAAAPALQRLRRRRQLWAMYYYRSGGTKFVNGRRVRGAAELVLASILGPARVRAGVANVLGSRRSKG